jgi:hypothetical protein
MVGSLYLREKATMLYYGSMVHWNRGSTKPGNRVVLSWWNKRHAIPMNPVVMSVLQGVAALKN